MAKTTKKAPTKKKAPAKRKRYTNKDKLEALAILQSKRYNYAESEKATGITEKTLRKWVADGEHHAIQEDLNREHKEIMHVTAEELLQSNKKYINYLQGGLIDDMIEVQQIMLGNLKNIAKNLKTKEDLRSLMGAFKIVGDQIDLMKGGNKFEYNEVTTHNTQVNFFEDQVKAMKAKIAEQKGATAPKTVQLK